MKKINLMCVAIFCANPMISALAAQDTGDQYYDLAKVTTITPQFDRVNTPSQECHTEYVRETYSNAAPSVGGSIIGGITGGLLGSTIGRGNGRVAAAAVGAGIGAVVGDRIDNQNNGAETVERPVQRCTTVDHWQTIQRGYLVNYIYNGRSFSTVVYDRPGDTIRVRIAVAAVIDGPDLNHPAGIEYNDVDIVDRPPPRHP